ncbi:MAG TPA: M42 family metallopeptidase [Firmicutes bacterium]|nr:M42 family metallopeptidase [Bacillota bacterium]
MARVLAGAGVSGYEAGVADVVEGLTRDLADEIRRDKLGNLIMLKRGEGSVARGGGSPGRGEGSSGRGEGGPSSPKIMLAAHMDEIGLMITRIEKEGALRFTQVGGIDQRILPGQEVIVHGRRELPGVIGAKPPHIQEPDENKKAVKMENLYIDVGMTREELEKAVSVGDIATFRRQPVFLKNDFLAGKALDDRAGVGVLFECLKRLQSIRHQADVYCVATVQEEVGIRGAMVSTYGVTPDIGIAIDVGHGEMPTVPEYLTLNMGKGPAIAFGPQVHPKIFDTLTAVAKEEGIPYQVEPSPHPGGTDAWAIQVTREGVPSALISIPLRYMHTSVETVSLEDIKRGGQLLASFIARVDHEFLEGLRCF